MSQNTKKRSEEMESVDAQSDLQSGYATPDSEILYGRQTQLGVMNFGTPRRRFADVPALIRSYAHVKGAAASANLALGVIDSTRAQGIQDAVSEILAGRHDQQFPTALVLGGGGTTSNMNVNEVIANRASQLAGTDVHPNDHVNASQSTNDTYPTAMALTVLELSAPVVAAVENLIAALERKGTEFAEVRRLGRTCLQDAVTLTVGQTHQGQATGLKRGVTSLQEALKELTAVPLGATVLGTGIGAPEGYSELAVAELARTTGLPLTVNDDFFDALAHLDTYAAVASTVARIATLMAKIAADFRLLSSGPGGGLAELTLPAVQAGSSIMPGKINPAIPEFVMQLSYRIRGASHTVESAVAAGELELNVMEPVIVDALIDMFDDLAGAANVFTERCVNGLEWNRQRLESNAVKGYDKWVALAAEDGYDAAAAQVRSSRAAKTREV
ncbi:lyase family protein [Brevibacterium casei]